MRLAIVIATFVIVGFLILWLVGGTLGFVLFGVAALGMGLALGPASRKDKKA